MRPHTHLFRLLDATSMGINDGASIGHCVLWTWVTGSTRDTQGGVAARDIVEGVRSVVLVVTGDRLRDEGSIR
jgi:hypothetical protein